jgi:hypothetical protein
MKTIRKMKTIMRKGDDYLSAEESLGTILWNMGLVKDIEDECGYKRVTITDNCVIEVRRIRNKGK